MSDLRIILADDHAVLRDGLAFLINRQPGLRVVGQAGDGLELLNLVRLHRPDLVVMDLSMPKLGGLEATERLKTEFPEVRIVILTMHEDTGYLTRLVRAGADGFMLKRSAAERLIEGIRTVAGGQTWFDPALAAMALRQELQPKALASEPATHKLSEREEEVLRLLALGYANKEVADKLHLSVKTVETYRGRIAEKLGLRSRVEMVQYALRQGWLQQEP